MHFWVCERSFLIPCLVVVAQGFLSFKIRLTVSKTSIMRFESIAKNSKSCIERNTLYNEGLSIAAKKERQKTKKPLSVMRSSSFLIGMIKRPVDYCSAMPTIYEVKQEPFFIFTVKIN